MLYYLNEKKIQYMIHFSFSNLLHFTLITTGNPRKIKCIAMVTGFPSDSMAIEQMSGKQFQTELRK